MHDRLFGGATAGEWGQDPNRDFPTFLEYAKELRMDSRALQQCVESSRFAPQIEADYRAASAIGVRSTPSFVVNGQLIVGAQPFEVWKDLLDKQLKQ